MRRTATERGYDARWRKLRLHHLAKEPLCRRCLPSVVPATVVHHMERHHGDPAKLYDPANLESLCKRHHDSDAQREELGTAAHPIGADGYPLDGSWE